MGSIIAKMRLAWRSSPFLRATVKNAVNAACVTVGPMLTDKDYNMYSWSGIWHLLVLMGGAIATREIMFWLPKILAWTQTAEADSDSTPTKP